MPAKTPETLTPAEWKVMKVVWQQGSGAARDVYEVAGDTHGWAPSTVKTILRRLVSKPGLFTSLLLRARKDLRWTALLRRFRSSTG